MTGTPDDPVESRPAPSVPEDAVADPSQAPKHLVLLRHGRTEWNLVGRAQGHADVPLDAVGRAQAAAVAPLIARLRPARLWSSDLARAAETASYLAEATGLAVEHDARLREFAVGERQGLTFAEALERFPHLATNDPGAHPLAGIPGVEDDDEVRARMAPALEDCLAALEPGRTGVVVTHGAALRLGLVAVLGWDEALSRALTVLHNCHWACVEVSFDGVRRRLASYGVGDFASVEGTR